MAKQSNQEIFHGGLASHVKKHLQTDVKLKGGDSDPGATISAHKLILAARSKVFKKMLEKDECKASSEKEIITLSEMKHEEVEALVQFMYSSGSCVFFKCFKKHARSLYLAADKYEIPYLRDLCRIELRSSLNLTNALDVLELAQIPFDKALEDTALRYITDTKNISKIASSDGFKLFAISNPNLTVKILKASVDQNRCFESRHNCCRCGDSVESVVCVNCTDHDHDDDDE